MERRKDSVGKNEIKTAEDKINVVLWSKKMHCIKEKKQSMET